MLIPSLGTRCPSSPTCCKNDQRHCLEKIHVVWDLVSWALNDEDAQVRRTVAKSLPRLAKQDVRMGTMFAERAIADVDPDVRLSAIKTIENSTVATDEQGFDSQRCTFH